MLMPSLQRNSGSESYKISYVLRRLLFIASLVFCFSVYQASTYHDQLTTQIANHITGVIGLDLQDYQIPKEGGIPKKIWYKLGPQGKTQETESWTDSCINQNPGYRYEFMTDDTADRWVEETFSSTRPDIVEVYLNLTVPILKADILRYLLLYAEGGVWSDLDVSCEGIPIDEWIPEEHKEATALVLGWEYDMGLDRMHLHQFTIWSILSKPGVAHMMRVIDDIIDAVYEDTAEWEITIPELTMEVFGDVLDYTGPRAFTRSIMRSLGQTLGAPVDRDLVENIREPLRVADVLILPGYAFSKLMNHYDESEGPVGPSLVTHHYAGSWKNEYGGELQHLAPSQVERV